jgi:hypothetical protein
MCSLTRTTTQIPPPCCGKGMCAQPALTRDRRLSVCIDEMRATAEHLTRAPHPSSAHHGLHPTQLILHQTLSLACVFFSLCQNCSCACSFVRVCVRVTSCHGWTSLTCDMATTCSTHTTQSHAVRMAVAITLLTHHTHRCTALRARSHFLGPAVSRHVFQK